MMHILDGQGYGRVCHDSTSLLTNP